MAKILVVDDAAFMRKVIRDTLTKNGYTDVHEAVDGKDAVEKYFVLENQQTFEDILALFIHSGWKLILTIRSAYKESFQNLLLHKINVLTYHLSPVSHDTLRELSTTYQFCLPQDQKLLDLLCAPFYLGLYRALDHLEAVSNQRSI